ncbi:MAG: MotA/TolQ/ExbB proton channel family protein [Chloroflexi bacterium]|nr:MotA/TolQ/ExbB proton channel family protein [Chloroflexota bacterium]
MTHACTLAASGSLLKFITDGGVIGYVIVAMSVVALAVGLAQFAMIRRGALLPRALVEDCRREVQAGRLARALELCRDPARGCYVGRILAAGLARAGGGALGLLQVREAMQEAGDAETARLVRWTDAIAVIASVAPLLGLLGTVQGMIGAFEGVAAGAVNDAAYYETLASNISLALITTFQGLVVAIPCTAAHVFLRNRIEAAAAEAGEVAESFAELLEQRVPGSRA